MVTKAYKYNIYRDALLINQKFLDFFTFIMSIFVTTPIIAIKIQHRYFSLFSIFLGLFLITLFTKIVLAKSPIIMGKHSKLYFLWLYLSLISSFFGLIYFSSLPEWFDQVLSYIPKLFLFLAILIFFSMLNEKEKNRIIKVFFIGFLIGCIMNIIWAIIDGVGFYLIGFSLNNLIFKNYLIEELGQERAFASIIRFGTIRVSGFNYDPAHLGGIVPIIILFSLLKRNYFLLLLSIIVLIFSQSNTCMISSLILILLNFNKIFSLKFESLSKLLKRMFFILILTIFVCILLLSYNTNSITIQSVTNNFEGFLHRIEYYSSFEETNPRIIYHLHLPIALYHAGVKILTGTGFGTSSYSYLFNFLTPKVLDEPPRPYDPESTYISYLFDVGVLGLILYIFILYKLYDHFRKNYKYKMNSLVFSSIGAIIFSGLFYHYTLTAYQVLIIIMASSLADMQQKSKNMLFEAKNG
jgi:hypothetical protein